jgi:hypothetical protein
MPDASGKTELKVKVTINRGSVFVEGAGGNAAFQDVLEISLPRSSVTAQVRLSFWRDGLPIQAIPPQDYLVIPTAGNA